MPHEVTIELEVYRVRQKSENSTQNKIQRIPRRTGFNGARETGGRGYPHGKMRDSFHGSMRGRLSNSRRIATTKPLEFDRQARHTSVP
jgi:hypothetical protein